MTDSQDEDHWIFLAIGLLRLFGKKDGFVGLLLICLGMIGQNFDEIPVWVNQALFWIGSVVTILAFARMFPYIRMSSVGVPMVAKVTDFDERKRSNPHSRGYRYERRAVYRYEIDGEGYMGRTFWVGKRKFGDLKTGDELAILVDPKNKKNAFAEKEIPTANPDEDRRRWYI
jgi:hypothetical protein